jgi:hypothetical protein
MDQLSKNDMNREIQCGGFWIRVGAYFIDYVVLNIFSGKLKG